MSDFREHRVSAVKTLIEQIPSRRRSGKLSVHYNQNGITTVIREEDEPI